ncbi:MAG TPA: class F sortase [Pseudonocardia sp.]|jgi:LPXTG-site transpeptidase (sortase) family protein
MTWLRAALAALVLVVATGCGGGAAAPGSGDGPNLSAPTVAGPAVPSVVALAPSPPVRLEVDAIHATSSLVPLGLNPDKTVSVPPVSQPLQAGWYRFGPTPGAVGPAVILGHVNGNGQNGIFARLHELKPGDQVKVSRQDGKTALFTVTRLQQVPKNTFPTREVYGDTKDSELRLITCGGGFDRAKRSYVDNILVFATLTGVV